MERLDQEGQPKSRGVGFVEFEEHEHALACLRQLNNNPNVVSPQKRPIVEFAIESIKVLKLRERKLHQQQEKSRKRALAESAHV
jgi:nucleolar protein 4